MFESLLPEVGGDGLGPSVGSMQEHGAGTFGDIADTPFCHPILVMGTDTAEGNGLPCLADILHKGTICKATIVAMIMPDAYGMLMGDALESMFGVDCFLRSHGMMQMYICEARSMVGKHTCTTVSACCWLTPCDWDKARNRGFQLVNADHSTRDGRWFDLGINLVCSPWPFVGFSVQATWAFRWRHVGQLLGDNSLFGKFLKLGKRGMPELLMVHHQ